MTNIPSDELKRKLALAALMTDPDSTSFTIASLVSLAHRAANGLIDRDEVIQQLADMVLEGHLSLERLGEAGDDPGLVKAVTDRLK